MPFADLVLEGGGVKAIGLVGAVSVLEDTGFQFSRVAGTSAGALVGALIAAGMSSQQLIELMRHLDYKSLEDGGRLARLGAVGESLSALFEHGAFRGDYLHEWVLRQLASLGVHTWADLRCPGSDDSTPMEERYRLVVIASDISRGKMLRLPWDYAELCGLDPDKQLVADAVRASTSIPFFFAPVRLDCGGGHDEHTITLVDGGLLSKFPVDIFDARSGPKPWPTIGVKLSAKPGTLQDVRPTSSGLQMVMAILSTMATAHDQRHIDDPSVQRRTIFVDTMAVRSTHFTIEPEIREQLLANGRDAAARFVSNLEVKPGLARQRTRESLAVPVTADQ
jgi:NTE family protein